MTFSEALAEVRNMIERYREDSYPFDNECAFYNGMEHVLKIFEKVSIEDKEE